MEPLIKDTLNKGHLCIKDTFQCTNLYSGNTFFASERGQPLYNGQNDASQCVRYLEVPLYNYTALLSKKRLTPHNYELGCPAAPCVWKDNNRLTRISTIDSGFEFPFDQGYSYEDENMRILDSEKWDVVDPVEADLGMEERGGGGEGGIDEEEGGRGREGSGGSNLRRRANVRGSGGALRRYYRNTSQFFVNSLGPKFMRVLATFIKNYTPF